MIRPRALAGPVMAMARPARPGAERAAVVAAAAALPMIKSRRGKAAALARRVLAELCRELERDPLLARLEQLSDESPLATLTGHIQGMVNKAQAQRLRARGGRFLSILEQRAEVQAIAADLEPTLARRYDRHLGAS